MGMTSRCPNRFQTFLQLFQVLKIKLSIVVISSECSSSTSNSSLTSLRIWDIYLGIFPLLITIKLIFLYIYSLLIWRWWRLTLTITFFRFLWKRIVLINVSSNFLMMKKGNGYVETLRYMAMYITNDLGQVQTMRITKKSELYIIASDNWGQTMKCCAICCAGW